MKKVIPTPAELRLYESICEGLSDMDYSYNPTTGEYDIPAAEFDGPFGKHWVKYESEAARDADIERRAAADAAYMIEWITNHRARVAATNKRKGEAARLEREAKTLGVRFPVLKELRKSLK